MLPLHVDSRGPMLSARLAAAGVGGAVVTSAVNRRWLTGFTGSAGMLVVSAETGSSMVLVTDGRYVEQATRETVAAKADVVVVERRSQAELRAAVAAHMASIAGRNARWALETSDITLSEFDQLQAACGAVDLDFDRSRIDDASAIFSDLRRTKSPAEVERIALAARIADVALGEIASSIVAGVTEAEIRDVLEAAMRRHGADDVSFATIVAAGDNAALPHHQPSSREVRAGEAVVIDFGALVEGYHSDMTRTFVVGGPGADEMLERHAVVRASCEAGVARVAPGVVASEVDAACRRVLAVAGLEHELTHGVGHGVGLQIHEPPFLGPRATGSISAGMAITVEPGAYLPGQGGVRIEDTLAVTHAGARVLTEASRALRVVAA